RGGMNITLFLTLLIIVSFLTLIVSIVSLSAVAINMLLKKLNLPSVTLVYPVFKILSAFMIVSFVVLLVSSMTANEIGLRAHDEDDSSVMHNDGMEDREVISDANEMKDEVATEDKEKTSDIDDQKEIEESHKENSDKKTAPKKKKPPKELSELNVHFIDVGQADAALV